MKRRLITIAVLFFGLNCHAQEHNWQNKDLKDDSIFGISTEKAYRTFIKDKKLNLVIVAIIDSGIDTLHEDLKPTLWTNSREIPGNGVDDDNNGYIDDVHGWNFLGAEVGKEDLVNLIARNKSYSDEYNQHVSNAKAFLSDIQDCEKRLDALVRKMGKTNPKLEDFKAYEAADGNTKRILNAVINTLPSYSDFDAYKKYEIFTVEKNLLFHLGHGLSLSANTEDDKTSDNKGNGMVQNEPLGLTMSPNISVYHGTHIAGIIGAVRNNGIGINGIANHVAIMPLKLLSNIRELRDSNLVAAIRYAVDNGARIINISFSKPFSLRKTEVDDAVKYAMSKNVLIVHAAGNTGEDLDYVKNYPNRIYKDSTGVAGAWIEAGASGARDDETLIAPFSNFGKNNVDVFAPGVNIYSCIPGNHYTNWSGTSMAAPMVVGLAALIWEIYPQLSAVQVKDIIMRSVVKRAILKDKCLSGGVVNAYNALKLAGHYK